MYRKVQLSIHKKETDWESVSLPKPDCLIDGESV